MNRIDVAIAIICRGPRVLICRRPEHHHLGGYWEFPGGKVEGEETPEQCLKREVREEVDLQVQIISVLPPIEHDYPDRSVRLHPFICACNIAEPKAIGCTQLLWVPSDELSRYKFPSANERLLIEITQYFTRCAS